MQKLREELLKSTELGSGGKGLQAPGGWDSDEVFFFYIISLPPRGVDWNKRACLFLSLPMGMPWPNAKKEKSDTTGTAIQGCPHTD